MIMSDAYCNYQWTTGTGPDDLDDTGVHCCAYRPFHSDSWHYCRCGAKEVKVAE